MEENYNDENPIILDYNTEREKLAMPEYGRNVLKMVEDVKEKEEAMTLLMKTQTGKDFEFNERLVSIVSVIRIQVSEYTAKHRPLPGQEPTRK